MKNIIDPKRVWTIFSAEFKMRLKGLSVWGGILMGILLMYMLLFPAVKEMAIDKMEAMPEELLALFGMGNVSDFANYNTYFSSIFQIILTIISAYAIFNAASCLHEEEANGTIEFLNASKVSRLEIYMAKASVIVTNLIIIMTLCAFAVVISGLIVEPNTVNVDAIIRSITISTIAVLAFAGIGFLVSTITPKSRKASGLGLGIFFGTYIIGYLAAIGPKFLNFLKWLSPLDYLSTNNVMTSTIGIGTADYNIFGIVLGIIIIYATTIGGYFIYRKKDLG